MKHDPLQPHSHDPNPAPPSDSPSFVLRLPDGQNETISVQALRELPETAVADCYIVSTGHGTSGPFTFSGVTLLTFIQHHWQGEWSQVEVISGDKFGNRVTAAELFQPDPAGPILLATEMDERPLTRQEGLIRMIVPSEIDDALRQVKWVEQINIR